MRTSSKPWYWEERDGWYVQVNRKRTLLAKGKANKAEAKRKWHELMSAGEAPKDRWLQDCVDRYLAKVSPGSLRNRKQILDAFTEHAGRIKASRVTVPLVESYLKPDWSPSTVRTHIKTIMACLNKAVKDRLIAANPIAGMEKPAWEKREKILSGEELGKLLEAAKGPFKEILEAMVATGCRPSEVCGVKVEDCHPDDGVWLVANKTKDQTGVKMRPVYLNTLMVEKTKKLMEGRTQGVLFRNAYGDPWTTDTLRLRFSRLRKKLGLSEGVIPYGTRHRFGSDAINHRKMDSLVVARLMGHSDARMLQKTYFREEAASMIEAVKKATGG